MNRVRTSRRASVLDCGDGVFGVAALGGCSRVDGGLRDLTKLQIPSCKSQRSSKHQAPKRPAPHAGQGFGGGRQAAPEAPPGFETWSLFGACLELGVWSLELYQP